MKQFITHSKDFIDIRLHFLIVMRVLNEPTSAYCPFKKNIKNIKKSNKSFQLSHCQSEASVQRVWGVNLHHRSQRGGSLKSLSDPRLSGSNCKNLKG